jgi:hypothetical protein
MDAVIIHFSSFSFPISGSFIGMSVEKIACVSINCPVHPQFSRDPTIVASSGEQ